MFKSILLALLCAAILLSGCVGPISGSGDVVSQKMDISEFNKVSIGSAFEADITQGDDFGVVISVDDNLVEYLDVVKQGRILKIGLKPNIAFGIQDATLNAVITMPELTDLDLSGASQAYISGFASAEDLSIDITGASSLDGDIDADAAKFGVSGSSMVILSGSAEDVKINVSGSSTLDLADFKIQDASIDASGASAITVNAIGDLKVEASGASTVNYIGSPELKKTNTSGASSINKLE